MKLTRIRATAQALPQLGGVKLNQRNQKLLKRALRTNGGDPAWRGRKEAEATDLLRLSQIAPPGRLHVDRLDLKEHLRTVLFMRVPVPCKPETDDRLPIMDFAVLGVTYPREVLQKRLPGMVFVQIFEPHGVWLANVGEEGQPLCLGDSMPVGIPLCELVLRAYTALSMQSIMIDQFDPAGVLNHKAAEWWQQTSQKTPLSETPFLVPQTS